jgi:hypothetical protein
MSAALAEAPAVTCGREACEARGTLCRACSTNGGPPQPADPRAALTDGQVFFMLRVKLLAACREGISFDSAWRYTTGEIIESVPPETALGWRRALDNTRIEFADAYQRHAHRRA